MNKKKMILIWIGVAAACLLIGLAGAEMYKFLGPNNSYVNITQYLGLNGADEWAVLLNTEQGDTAVKEGEITYISLDYVLENISPRFYFDESLQSLCIVSPDEIKTVALECGDFRTISGKKYISTELIKTSYPCEIIINENDNIVWIWSDYKTEYSKKLCKSNAKMRVSASIRGEIVCDVNEGESLLLLGEEGNYTKCITEKGLLGFIKTDELSEKEVIVKEYLGSVKETFDRVCLDDWICMGWHMLDEYLVDVQTEKLEELIEREEGLNVISPTWYSILDESGNIKDLSDIEYVKRAEAAGINVWGLVDNFADELNNLTLLKNYEARQRLIKNLIDSAKNCGMAGINIDFESSGAVTGGLNKECGPHFLQFMRELTLEAHKSGLVISVDVPAPYSYNSYFNRSELGKVVDYVIVMGYDEHYSGSEPGSVASYDFVKSAISKTIEEVPKERVVLGVPFYTRQWTLGSDGEIIGTREKGEAEIEANLITYGANKVWHENERQNYAEFYNEFGLVKVWLDDAASLQWKMDLCAEYGVSGASAWRLGVETEEMWEIYTKTQK